MFYFCVKLYWRATLSGPRPLREPCMMLNKLCFAVRIYKQTSKQSFVISAFDVQDWDPPASHRGSAARDASAHAPFHTRGCV